MAAILPWGCGGSDDDSGSGDGAETGVSDTGATAGGPSTSASATSAGSADASSSADGTTGGDPVVLEDGDRTMIFSHVEYFCEGTEGSTPFAWIEFAFVDDGELVTVHTATDCEDITAFVPGRILGEAVTFEAPDTIVRADGSSYSVVLGGVGVVGYDLQTPLLFVSSADDAALVTNEDPTAYIAECETLTSTLSREVCLLWQIQLGELDPATCDEFTEVPANLCVPYPAA